jgi:uncharacterized RDD family membrane protein YckC
VIDLVILNGALFVVGLVIGLIIEAFGKFSPDWDAEGIAAVGIVWSLAFAIYFTTSWALTGQTPGMRALGIKSVAEQGRPACPRGVALVRVIGMLAAAIPFFGRLPPDPRHRAAAGPSGPAGPDGRRVRREGAAARAIPPGLEA